MEEAQAPETGALHSLPLLARRSLRPSSTSVQLFQADITKSNRIHTNKYTWYSFVPRNLFEQFSQLGNAYFLLVALLQCINSISNTHGKPLTLVPLTFVIFMGALKDAFEDIQRFLSDRRENMGQAVIVHEDLSEETVHWQDIHPGMVLVVQEGERLPVDGLVLASDLPDGECYVETANLDGESNLKKKAAAITPAEWEELHSGPGKGFSGVSLEVEPPSVDLYKFNGALRMPGESEPRGTHIGNVLLRGTSLQRTGKVYCLAVYCGSETRAMQNSQSARFKASKLDVELNRVVLMIFGLQFLICSTLSLCSIGWLESRASKAAWYLDMEMSVGGTLVTLIIRLGTWVLQTNSMVPVSLMVTLTGVKFAQGLFISWDRMCGDVDNGKPAKVNTSQVIESLGQISHVFSDKTGTLTMNVMEYKACSVAGRIYGLEGQEQAANGSNRGRSSLASLQEDVEEGKASIMLEKAVARMPHVCFHAAAFRRDLGAAEDVGRPAALASFLLCHALCHSVEVEGGEGQNARGSRASLAGTAPLYQASSPDELALVYMSHAMGLEFIRLSEGQAKLRVRDATLATALEAACGGPSQAADGFGASGRHGASLSMEVLDVCDFDNDRKRSSIVVRYPNGRLVLLLKGADTSVLPYVSSGVSLCEEHLSHFAQRGLRTLCLAMRYLSEEEHADWHARYAQAQALVSSDRPEQVQRMAIELETNKPLELLGSTAIEDRLQDQVPETIEQLRLAGICVWVLTGDKVETAISIARSCRLLTEDMTNILVEDPSPESVERDLNRAIHTKRPALTVAGAALSTALATEERQLLFLDAAVRCRSVVCCRVSPKQKADVVQLVKTHKASATTLSIGDGANDVSMIVAAHVGVGISGKEGAQAAYTADFAISEFRYLRRLLFVHGRESYRRTAVVIFYNFYKNMLMVAPTIFFAPLSGFTGQNVFFPWLCQLYNVLYTHFAVCFFGICDRSRANLDDLEVESAGYAPRLFSPLRAFVWIMAAVTQAYVVSKVTMKGLRGGVVVSDGFMIDDLFTWGYLCFLNVIICANLTMALRQSSWIFFMWFVYAANVGSAFVSVWMFNKDVMGMLFLGDNLPRVLLTTLLAVFASFLVGEFIIRHCGPLEDAMLRAMGKAAPQAGPPIADGTSDDSARELSRVSLTPMEVEMNSLPSLVEEQVASYPQLQTKRGSTDSAERSKRLSSFGYAFSQECAVERGKASSWTDA